MRLTKAICETYGFSSGCDRCRFYKYGKQTLSKSNHSPACRQRMYDAMKQAGDLRLKIDKIHPRTEDNQPMAPNAPSGAEDLVHKQEQAGKSSEHDDDPLEPTLEEILAYDEPSEESMQIDVLTDVCITHGVECVDAQRAARRICRVGSGQRGLLGSNEKRETTFMDIFGRGAICDMANVRRRNLNVTGLDALDLRTCMADGTPWDFNIKRHRKLARELIAKLGPEWIIGSPPMYRLQPMEPGDEFP